MIHPEKHFAPILRLSSACSCMKVDDSVVVIILACEQSVKLCGVKTVLESFQLRLYLIYHVLAALIGCHFNKHFDILK